MKNYSQIFNLKEKKVLVVGGSGLIGSEIARALVDFKAHVTVLDLKNNNKFKNNQNIKFIKFDCSNYKKIKVFFLDYLKKNKCPDILINTSYPATKDWKKNSFQKVNFYSYKKNIEMHLNSYVWISKILADEMKRKKKRGVIIHIGSIYGLVAQDEKLYQKTNIVNNMTYGLIKSSIIHFTRQMAGYYGSKNIRINNVILGGIEGHIKGSRKKQDKNFIKKYSYKVPLQRMGKITDIPSSIIFLCSDASSYITGTNILIDGGYTSL